MNLPINGRIAIIDDQIIQALPIIEVLSKQQCPILYFSGDLRFLPDETDNYNDIRVLFLDIELNGNNETPKVIKRSRLISVLNRVISVDNFPYVLIYWSRHYPQDKELVEAEVFTSPELKNKRPIAFLSANKSDFFSYTGDRTPEFDENLEILFARVDDILGEHLAFSYLVEWENAIHSSTDSTLQTAFRPIHNYDQWANEANHLLTSLGKSVAGHHYRNMDPKTKMANSFMGLNNILQDEIEAETSSTDIDYRELEVNEEILEVGNRYGLNTKLLFSKTDEAREYPGALMKNGDAAQSGVYNSILNSALRNKISEEVVKENEHLSSSKIDEASSADKKTLEKELKAIIRAKRAPFDDAVEKVVLIVTSLCDYVQKKAKNCRVLKGIILPAECLEYLSGSDAIYCSPIFEYNEKDSVLIVDLKYFFTKEGSFPEDQYEHIMRVRNLMLAEIQSRLARHITRSGLLFLE